MHSHTSYSPYPTPFLKDTTAIDTDQPLRRKKHFLRAAGETFGMNMSLWAFDRYVLKGHYAYISWHSIKENFKNGFEWDNDHLNTNMFAHPYNGSLFFNAGRSNGYNFWQSELFAISGSAMWELFMECEHPSTNDIIATPIGGAALGEVFYRVSDLFLDNRTSGRERAGREVGAFIVSPMRGITRLLTGEAWKKSRHSGKEFPNTPVSLDVSVGSRMLLFHDNESRAEVGASARLDMEYGDPFEGDSKTPYDYFSFLTEFNLMKTQPLLSRVEIIGRLLSKELVDTKKVHLSLGLFQHFDFFDSDTISQYKPGEFDPCVVPYKLGTPASVGVGSLFRYQNNHSCLTAYAHFNGVLLGGILSDYYRYYNRNYNWASGFSAKIGIKGVFNDNRLSFSVKNHLYRLYTNDNGWSTGQDWSETPAGKPVNVKGDDSRGTFYHVEAQIDYRLRKQLFLTSRLDYYSRGTWYEGRREYETSTLYDWYVDSKQLSMQLMLTYKF